MKQIQKSAISDYTCSVTTDELLFWSLHSRQICMICINDEHYLKREWIDRLEPALNHTIQNRRRTERDDSKLYQIHATRRELYHLVSIHAQGVHN